jgi:peptidoglycan/xylan/chitin deacetylase (PgdA/CDA1 family)
MGGRRTRRATGSVVALLVVVLAILVMAGEASAATATVVSNGPRDKKQVALTFDDNSLPERALPILKILNQYKVPATMFVIGTLSEKFPDITTEIAKGVKSGLFEVGDHTRSHPMLPRVSPTVYPGQIGGGTDAFRRLTGVRTVPLFRPPGGEKNATVISVAASEGFRYVVLWDVDPRDWAGRSAEQINNNILSNVKPGSIVVMHLCAPHTAEALPYLITSLRSRGYELVTVSQMLKGDRRFVDVDERAAPGQAIGRLVDLGYMVGRDKNYFEPSVPVTPADVARLVLRTTWLGLGRERALTTGDLLAGAKAATGAGSVTREALAVALAAYLH